MGVKKKPEGWYGFKIRCPLYSCGLSNMVPESEQQYCARKDRYGNERPKSDPLSCRWNVCPRLPAELAECEGK